jgi:ADP-ribosylglycohydrolase
MTHAPASRDVTAERVKYKLPHRRTSSRQRAGARGGGWSANHAVPLASYPGHAAPHMGTHPKAAFRRAAVKPQVVRRIFFYFNFF